MYNEFKNVIFLTMHQPWVIFGKVNRTSNIYKQNHPVWCSTGFTGLFIMSSWICRENHSTYFLKACAKRHNPWLEIHDTIKIVVGQDNPLTPLCWEICSCLRGLLVPGEHWTSILHVVKEKKKIFFSKTGNLCKLHSKFKNMDKYTLQIYTRHAYLIV